MSDELKQQASIDTPEFRALLDWHHDINNFSPAESAARIIAHLGAWGARMAGEAAKDAERLDWLETKASEPEGLLLHDGCSVTGRRGLGLKGTRRTLRQAIDAAAAPSPTKEQSCG